MKIQHFKTVVPYVEAISRVQAACWSPNNQKLAIANADRAILVFDENGERKDKFATKAADPQNPTPYNIVGLAFSPDSTKLAVAQNDGGIYVYRLGLEWGEKKSICNKFIQQCPVGCMVWPKDQHMAIVFGTADGKVKIGNLKSNKAVNLYQVDDYVACLAASPDGNSVVSGHNDGTIQLFAFDDGRGNPSQCRLAMHPCAPYTIAFAEQSVFVCDQNEIISVYNLQGKVLQTFDYSRVPKHGDLTVSLVSPNAQCVLVGTFEQIHVFLYQRNREQWLEEKALPLQNYLQITALAWKPDGSRVVVGNLTGQVDLYDCCLKRTIYNGTFEFTHVSLSQVLVKRLSTGARIMLKSAYGYEIQNINIYNDQYLVANTEQTICLGDLASCKLSEIQWQGGGNEKFSFSHPGICMMFNAGELLLIEYGVNEILASCRTEFPSPHLLSVRLNERKSSARMIAYLIDSQTIQIMDIDRPTLITSIHHDNRIDWLELSGKANKLLFRDGKKELYLVDVATQEQVTLLSYCTYVQWVPNSDVVVAQTRDNMCVWYGINSPDRVTMHPIKGDVVDIVRENGVTSVLVDEGITNVTYTLDEGLIEFGTAVDDLDWGRALNLLETLELTPETEAMWKTLSELAMQNRKLPLAERCYAAIGDLARANYLRKIVELAERVKISDPMINDPYQHYLVRAKLAVVDKDFKVAERIYLEQGHVQEAMEMYQELHKWDASIKVAEIAHHPDVDTLRQHYFEWLVQSGQEARAAELREEEGDTVGAIQLYLKAHMPSRAAMLIKQRNLLGNLELVERTAHALLESELYERAGDFFLVLGQRDKALAAYEKGNCFKSAIDLCRTHNPVRVIEFEEKWGEHLVHTRQLESAIHHFIEANQNIRALEVAMAAKSWAKAVGIADSLDGGDPNVARLCGDLAHHFESVGDYTKAERYFIKTNRPMDAIGMYNRQGMWEKAHVLAANTMAAEDVYHLYTQLAHDKESTGQHKDAEKLYLLIGEPDLAINMYKNAKDYTKMIELVAIYHKDLLNETHVFLGKTLETSQQFKDAEHHYVQANDWKSAVNMYCSNNMYEDAHRVAKVHGGTYAAKQVVYLWARSLGGDSGAKLLAKHSLLEYAIDFAAENAAFDFAFELCKHAKGKDSDVYLKQAMYHEDEGKFAEAEEAFVRAGKPKEAILMHIHNEDWESAQRVAAAHQPDAVADVLSGRAKMLFARGEHAAAEALWLQAQRPEAALAAYKEAGQWGAALRFAREYVPAKAAALAAEHDTYIRERDDASKDELLSTARMLEQQGDAVRAAEVYLKINSPPATSSGPRSANDPEVAAVASYWTRAVDLVLKFSPARPTIVSTAKTAAGKLAGIDRFETAGDVLALCELYKEAVEMYARAGNWEKCKQLGRAQRSLQEHIDALYVAHLKKHGQADALVGGLDVDAGCQVLAQRGDWDGCLAAAAKANNPALLLGYLMLFANQISAGPSSTESDLRLLKSLVQYGAPTTPAFLDLYAGIFARVLLDDNVIDLLLAVRELLKKLLTAAGGSGSAPPAEFKTYLIVAHLQYLRKYFEQRMAAGASPTSVGGSTPMASFRAKLSISLLRYRERPMPIDRALYLAGSACQETAAGVAPGAQPPPTPAMTSGGNLERMAFILLNRYLDVADAIEENDGAMGDENAAATAALNADAGEFLASRTGCDIPPLAAIPRTNSVSETERERVRDWVLSVSLEKRQTNELDKRTCENCSAKIYDPALACVRCQTVWEPCIITGYPVLKSSHRCGGCGMAANKDDWNKFVVQEKKCPWCLTTQGPAYSLK